MPMLGFCFSGFYEESKKIPAIVRNNRNYFLENIQPKDELIDSLLSLNCITEVQSQNIKRQCSKRDKNAELLSDMKSFDESTFPNFEKCLHKTNQKSVAKIFENGGGLQPKSVRGLMINVIYFIFILLDMHPYKITPRNIV